MNAIDAPCQNAGSGVDEAGCFSVAAGSADASLKEIYRQIMKVLSPGEQQQLASAEGIWLRYRDLTCIAERDLYYGSTGGITDYPACKLAVTRHRLEDLRLSYQWKVSKFTEHEQKHTE